MKEAQIDVEVTVKDDKGNTVEVKPVSVLDVGETTATFTFKTALTSEPTGTWTVNGVSFDANAQAAVNAVKDATNQVELLNALKSSYFTGVNTDLIAKYDEKDFSEAVTVADVQKVIDEVNADNVSELAVKAVNEAKNQVELLKALQDGGFARVNPNLIAAYDAKDFENAADADAVQALVDTVNKDAANTAVTAATTGDDALKTDAIAKAQTLVNALPEKTDEEKAAKKGFQDSLDKARAVAKVKGANTQASLLAALKAPELGLKNIDDTLAKFYKAAQADATIANVNADLQNVIIDQGKTDAIDATVESIKKVTEKTTDADVKSLLTELKRLNPTVFDAEIIDTLVGDYKTDLVEANLTSANTAKINTIIVTANDPATAVIKVTEANTADGLLDALNVKTLNLKNVKEANKQAYLDAPENKNGVSYFTKVTTPAQAQKTVNAVNAFVDANSATTATQLNSALNSFAAIISDDFFGVAEASNYINLSSAAKLEVAEIVLNAKDADYADAMELAVAIDTAVTNYNAFLGGVNDAASISTMNTALDKTTFPAFQELSPAEKVAKAEAVYNKLQELKAQDPATNFKTIAQVKAAAGL